MSDEDKKEEVIPEQPKPQETAEASASEVKAAEETPASAGKADESTPATAAKSAGEAPTPAVKANEGTPAAAAKPADEASASEVKADESTPATAAKPPSARPAASDAGSDGAAEAREARARARAAKKAEEDASADKPRQPSPNQPRLDRAVALLKELVAEDCVEEATINELDRHLPCLVIKPEHWVACAEVLRDHDELQLGYLRNVSGVDQETHLEVVYHLLSLVSRYDYCIKVKTDRETPSIPSVTGVWSMANWNEREIYDLLGIDFPGHPDLRRIMMSDDWVGHPLRKDYVPIDPEV